MNLLQKLQFAICDLSAVSGVASHFRMNFGFPKLALIPQLHESNTPSWLGTSDGPVTKICFDLRERYGVDAIVMEHLTPAMVERYNNGESDIMPGGSFRELFSKPGWKLYPIESDDDESKMKELLAPVFEIHREFDEREYKKQSTEALRAEVETYNRRIDDLLQGDYYDAVRKFIVDDRDARVANICREHYSEFGSPAMVIYGVTHTFTFMKHIVDVPAVVLFPMQYPVEAFQTDANTFRGMFYVLDEFWNQEGYVEED
jgi:hypothetical protein